MQVRDNLRKIAMFVSMRPSLSVQQTVVALCGSRLRHTLSLINALAIQLPAIGTAQALACLQGRPSWRGCMKTRWP